MTPEQAAWVRENVWTDYMRKAYDWRGCACQRSEPSTWCTADHHAWCDSGMPRPDYETLILDRNGMFPAWLPEPFEHAAPYPSDRDEHALRPLAFVWLADRVCETKCACDCGHPAVEPTPRPAPVTPRPVSRPAPMPMTEEAAAWVRANAWTPAMRRQPYSVPGVGTTYDHALAASLCECMAGLCPGCRDGRHEFCDRRKIAPRPEWWITNRPLDYIPPTAVWYADRACRSLCPCCPDGPPRRLRYETVTLPGLDLISVVA